MFNFAVDTVGRLGRHRFCPGFGFDQACVDLIYAMTEAENRALVERIESRHGHRQLSYMEELGMGNRRYVLIDLDNGGKRITPAEAVKGLKPFGEE